MANIRVEKPVREIIEQIIEEGVPHHYSLVWADVAARTILPRTEVPIGILISVVGAPFFIFLMVRKNYSFGGRA